MVIKKVTLICLCLIVFSGLTAEAAWQIDQGAYNAFLCTGRLAEAACFAPARVGNFKDRASCEKARRQGKVANDVQWLSRTFCVGTDETPLSYPAEKIPGKIENTERVDDGNFEREKAQLLSKLKDVTGNKVIRQLSCWAAKSLAAIKRVAADDKIEALRYQAQSEECTEELLPVSVHFPVPSGGRKYEQLLIRAQSLQRDLEKLKNSGESVAISVNEKEVWIRIEKELEDFLQDLAELEKMEKEGAKQ